MLQDKNKFYIKQEKFFAKNCNKEDHKKCLVHYSLKNVINHVKNRVNLTYTGAVLELEAKAAVDGPA